MNQKLMGIVLGSVFLMMSGVSEASVWTMVESKLSYTAKHPLKTTHGTSMAAKGKAECEKGKCNFLIAVPINTFKSGDSNRDLHMIEVTKGAAFPMVVAKTAISEKELDSAKEAVVDFEIQFAGKASMIKGVKVSLQSKDGTRVIDGTMPVRMSDFSMVSPSLLGLAIEDTIPVQFSGTWKK